MNAMNRYLLLGIIYNNNTSSTAHTKKKAVHVPRNGTMKHLELRLFSPTSSYFEIFEIVHYDLHTVFSLFFCFVCI